MAGACVKAWSHKKCQSHLKELSKKIPVVLARLLSYLQEMETPFFDPDVKRPLVLDCSHCSGRWMRGWAEINLVLPVPQRVFFSKKTIHCSHWPVFFPLIYMYVNSPFLQRIAHWNISCSSLVPSPFHWGCPGSWVTFFFVDSFVSGVHTLSWIHQKLEGLSVWSHTFSHLKQLLLLSLFWGKYLRSTGFVWCGVQLT